MSVKVTSASRLSGVFCALSQSCTSSTLLQLQHKILSEIRDPRINISFWTHSNYRPPPRFW